MNGKDKPPKINPKQCLFRHFCGCLITHSIHVWYIFTYIWRSCMVTVGRYTVHGSCGLGCNFVRVCKILVLPWLSGIWLWSGFFIDRCGRSWWFTSRGATKFLFAISCSGIDIWITLNIDGILQQKTIHIIHIENSFHFVFASLYSFGQIPVTKFPSTSSKHWLLSSCFRSSTRWAPTTYKWNEKNPTWKIIPGPVSG